MRTFLHRTALIGVCTTVLLLGATPVRSQSNAHEDSSTVQAVLDDPHDDRDVSLRGRLAKQVGEEKYLFQDETGGIRVEVEEEVMPSSRVSPGTTVVIRGEVEDDFLQSPEIDVEEMRIVEDPHSTPKGGRGNG